MRFLVNFLCRKIKGMNEATKIGREGGHQGDKMDPTPRKIYISIHTFIENELKRFFFWV